MKRLIVILLLAAILLVSVPVLAATQAEQPTQTQLPFAGNGTEDDPYRIATAEELIAFRHCVNNGHSFSNQYLLQTADIDLAGEVWTPIGVCGTEACFRGVYDGGGHVIENLVCTGTGDNGLFGMLGGIVMNLGIESGAISGRYCGAIAVRADKPFGIIVNCYNKASVSGKRAGGVVDDFYSEQAVGRIRGCWSDCALSGAVTGSIVSCNARSISYCFSALEAPLAADTMTGSAWGNRQVDRSDWGAPDMLQLLNSSIPFSAKMAYMTPDAFHTWQLRDGSICFSPDTYRFSLANLGGMLELNSAHYIRLGVAALLFAAFLVLAFLALRRFSRSSAAKRLYRAGAAFLRRACAFLSRISHKVAWSVFLLCALGTGAVFAIVRVPFMDILKFFAFCAFYILLPGYVLVRRVRCFDNSAALFALCMLGGMGLLTASYLLSSLVGSFLPLYAISPATACASVLYFIRDRKTGALPAAAVRPDIRLCAVAAVLTFLSFIVRAVSAASPEIVGTVSLFQDSLFIAENSAALVNGMPAVRFDLADHPFRYHLLSNLIQACAIRLTGIAAVDVYMTFWSLLCIPLSVCAVYALSAEYLAGKGSALRCTVVALCTAYLSLGMLYFFSGPEAIRARLDMRMGNIWVYLLFFPNGIDVAIPAILGAALLGVKLYRHQCALLNGCLLFFTCVFLATGAKTPFGLCIVGALCGTLLLSLLQGKRRTELKLPLLLLGVCALAFLSAYLLFIYDPSPVGAFSNSFLSLSDPRNSIRFFALFGYAVDALKMVGIYPGPVMENVMVLLFLPVAMFFLLPFAMPAFFAWVTGQLKRFREITPENMLLCGMAVCGLAAYFICAFDGYSQLYFFLPACLFIQIIGYGWFAQNYRRLKPVWKTVFILLLLCGFFFPVQDGLQRLDSTVVRMRAISLIAQGKARLYVPEPNYNHLTRYEYEAMLWIRDNTDPDAVLLADRFFTDKPEPGEPPEESGKATWFYYGAYAQRHLFLGGWSYSSQTELMYQQTRERLAIIHSLYAPETENRAALMRQYGISYLVLSRFVNEDMQLEDDELTAVFKNRDIIVYAPV